jgi:hypothetical protein
MSQGTHLHKIENPICYPDGRPSAHYRLHAMDAGVVLRHGQGPGRCDVLGARDVWVFQAGDTCCMHYDGAGDRGWLACLATSQNLVNWTLHGPILDFGSPGELDCGSASYGVTYQEGEQWHLFYLGTQLVSPAPEFVPTPPYQTLRAHALSPQGPWVKQKNITGVLCKPETYYAEVASPGQVIRHAGEYLQFFAAAAGDPLLRTIGIARASKLDGVWIPDLFPMVPLNEQIENSSLYFEETNQTWFLFTNHIGIDERGEYTDAIWVYWTKELNRWNTRHKAIVLDKENCAWSPDCIGLPSVVRLGNRLALFYDGAGGGSVSHVRRDIGLAWIDLPLRVPQDLF